MLKQKILGFCDVILELGSRSSSPKKSPVQVHFLQINIKYMEMLYKEIFKFQCGGIGADICKTKSMPAIAGHAQFSTGEFDSLISVFFNQWLYSINRELFSKFFYCCTNFYYPKGPRWLCLLEFVNTFNMHIRNN